MSADLTWLASEAKNIHAVFSSIFYSLLLTLMLFGVVIEYFKIPLGEMPSFIPLIGRSLIASIMLISLPDVMNLLSDFADGLSAELGGYQQFDRVLAEMSEHLDNWSANWLSVKDVAYLILGLISFGILYISVNIAEAFHLYSWTLLYAFSPLLICAYVLPATSGLTRIFYRSLVEVSMWKVVWSVLSTLLWGSVFHELSEMGDQFMYPTIVFFNLMLGFSLLFTPLLINALINNGISSLAPKMGAISMGATAFAVNKAMSTRRYIRPTVEGGKNSYFSMKDKYQNFSQKGKAPYTSMAKSNAKKPNANKK